MERKQLANNVLYSISAQLISFTVGFLLNLVVPKFISEYSYGLWQTYILYASYVGILHFGLLDGIVLRYSQYDYDELDKPRIRSQFQFLLLFTGFFSLLTSVLALSLFQGTNRLLIYFVAASIIVKNIFTYASYTFQITNRINKYAFLVISDRILYGLIVIILLLNKSDNYALYCIADLASDLIAFFISFLFNKELYFGYGLKLSLTMTEVKENVASGILLLIANWSSMFLTGSSKMFVQWHWDNLIFGKVSFAFSISNLLLQFVNAISVVLFPSLKRMTETELPEIYSKIRSYISPILFISIILYYPAILILNVWIPQYSSSFIYMGILFPVVVYTAKVSLLTNNYFKAYRKEKTLFFINLASVIFAVIIFAVCTYVFDNLNILLIFTVLVLMCRSIVSEVYVSKLIERKFTPYYLLEFMLTCVFVACSFVNNIKSGFIIYSLSLFVYLLVIVTMSKKKNRGFQ